MVERRNLLIAIALVAVVGIGAVGVVLSSSKTDINTFVMESIGDPEFLDPAVDYESAGGEVLQNVYEPLFWYTTESPMVLTPWLASGYTVSGDGLTYTFTLRTGITFHDGTPFNASVLKWTLDRCVLINDPLGPAWILMPIDGATDYIGNAEWSSETPNRTAIYEAAKAYLDTNGVEVVSETVLKIHMNYNGEGKPYPPMPYCLTNWWAGPMSASYVEAHGGHTADLSSTLAASDETDMSIAKYIHDNYAGSINLANGMGIIPGVHNTWMDEHTCGTGAFMVPEDGWVKTVSVTMVRYDNYWGTPSNTGPAKLQKVILKQVPEFDTRKLSLLSGDADCVYWGAVYADQLIDVNTRTVLPEYASQVHVVMDKPQLVVDQCNLNMNGTLALVTATKNVNPALGVHENPLQYKDFRKAVQYSFDHQAYINSLNGFAVEPTGPIVQGLVGYSPGMPKYTYDLTKAKALFDAVGWQGTIDLYYNTGNIARKTACLLLKDGVETATNGKVHINVQEKDWSTMLGMWRAKQMPLMQIGWIGDYPDADNFIIYYAHSLYGGFGKRCMYANATIDAILMEAATTLDPTTRTNLYKVVTLELYDEAFYIWLDQPTNFHVERSWVRGYYFNPMFSGLYYYPIYKV
jgi:peptide/nickel transport system substrate-binding protein